MLLRSGEIWKRLRRICFHGATSVTQRTWKVKREKKHFFLSFPLFVYIFTIIVLSFFYYQIWFLECRADEIFNKLELLFESVAVIPADVLILGYIYYLSWFFFFFQTFWPVKRMMEPIVSEFGFGKIFGFPNSSEYFFTDIKFEI